MYTMPFINKLLVVAGLSLVASAPAFAAGGNEGNVSKVTSFRTEHKTRKGTTQITTSLFPKGVPFPGKDPEVVKRVTKRWNLWGRNGQPTATILHATDIDGAGRWVSSERFVYPLRNGQLSTHDPQFSIYQRFPKQPKK